MTDKELRSKVDEINLDAQTRSITEEIECKLIEIEKLKDMINDLRVKKINLLKEDPGYYQGFTLINDVMVNHFKIKL